jgi:hypothetical protein
LAAAAAIVRKPVPDARLTSIVAAAVPWIRTNHETRQAVPARDSLRRRLISVRAAAATLSRELENWHQHLDKQTLVLLLEGAGLDRATINVLAGALPRLSAAATAAPTPEWAHGRKALPNVEALTPLQQCAALVAFTWQRASGELPPHTSTAAWAACEAVWLAAGLPDRARSGVSLSGWRQHLQHVAALINGETANSSFDLFWNGLSALSIT